MANDGKMDSVLGTGAAGGVALLSPESGATVTYAELAGRVEEQAGRLAAAGVRRGDRVAMALPNGADFVELLLAVTAVGAAAAPLNPAYTREEMTFYLGDIEPRLLLVPPLQPAARDAAETVGTPIVVVEASEGDEDADPGDGGTGGPAPLSRDGQLLERAPSFEAGEADDVALVLHTSGTTSRPKQVPLLQRNLMASAATIATFYGLGEGDVSFCAMPLFHVHGLVASALAALQGGGTVVVPRRFTPHRFWRQARANGVTWLSAGPTLHQMILDKVDGEGAPTTLRFVRSCSSALSPALMKRGEDVYGVPMVEAYGMTEASHQMASNPLPPRPRLAGSVGVATGTEIALVDAALQFVPAGGAGEVVIRGPGLTGGYVNNPQANAEAFFSGWFRTGDRGVLEDGYLTLQGRLKEMILRGGENISPAEIEDVLKGHPLVGDAVCFGVEDEKYGETVAAAVTLSGEVDEKTLVRFCRDSLAAFKVPETIFVVDEIPRTPTGKVQRRRVASWIAETQQG
jgi:acyl-CoA synthetase (AMP-forming)/AMP-acid ligase II